MKNTEGSERRNESRSRLNGQQCDHNHGRGSGDCPWKLARNFRIALDRARKQQKPRESRQELGRDRTKALVVLLAVAVVLLLLFFGSSPALTSPRICRRESSWAAQPWTKSHSGQETNDPNKAVRRC